ncbi:MAG TPA: DUF1398 family protein [Pirellulales bacterium]|nr:DUF1398 family protein [Pirellulales bacterium]
MNRQQTETIEQNARAAWTGEITFPEYVGRLAALGVERYHTDYSRHEVTYYLPDGDSLMIAATHEPHPIGSEFSPSAVEAALRQSQRGEHTYEDFVRKTTAAGCVGYFVQIAGRRAIYFGRNGDLHVEPFPPAPAGK